MQVSEPELVLVPRLVKFHRTFDPALDDSWTSVYRMHLEIYSRADKRLNKDERTSLSQIKWHIQPVNTFPRRLRNLLDLFLKASFVCLLCPMTQTQGSQNHRVSQQSLPAGTLVSTPTWSHLTVDVERLGLVGLDSIDSAVCLSFVEQLAAVCRQLWKMVMINELPN